MSCCMSPEHKPEERRKETPRAPNNKDSGVWADVFEYCLAVCRTHGRSTSHENAYIGARHHCFSKLGKPMVSHAGGRGRLGGGCQLVLIVVPMQWCQQMRAGLSACIFASGHGLRGISCCCTASARQLFRGSCVACCVIQATDPAHCCRSGQGCGCLFQCCGRPVCSLAKEMSASPDLCPCTAAFAVVSLFPGAVLPAAICAASCRQP